MHCFVYIGQAKKGFARPKGGEPGSPLLRRALSPDRLHPRSAESKCTLISPLCCASSGNPPVVKATPRGNTGTVWRATTSSDREKEHADAETTVHVMPEGPASTTVPIPVENRLSLNLSGPGELLPRIAEEKDSPTNSQEASKPEIPAKLPPKLPFAKQDLPKPVASKQELSRQSSLKHQDPAKQMLIRQESLKKDALSKMPDKK